MVLLRHDHRDDEHAQVLTLLPPLKALKITAHGHPQHPLHVKGDSPLLGWPARSAP